ncbi:MAG: LLM class F420-dependent oxidoreductase [Thermodesulfobacteriota bacterium]
MKFGIALPILRDVKLRVNIEIAKKAEELGFDSVWASDHVVVPTKYVGRFSEVFYDPFTLLTSIAANTNKIKIGTSVIIVPYRNPIVVAKMIATMDMLSEGRVIFGVGVGWMREEFETLGIPFKERGKRTDEYIKIYKELWEKDAPRFEGEFYKFSNIKFYPKPYQKPYPPIWIGGSSEKAIRRVVELGDGWQPTWLSPDDMATKINHLKNIARRSGRESKNFAFSVRNRLRIFNKDEKRTQGINIGGERPPFSLCGTAEEITNYKHGFKKIGVSHIVLDVLAGNDEEMFDMMERFAAEIMPIFSE